MAEQFAARDAWLAATELLKAEGKLSDSQLAFVRMAQPLAAVDDIFMLGVGSEFVKDWISEHVAPVMSTQLAEILGREIRLMISVDPALAQSPTINNSEHSTPLRSALDPYDAAHEWELPSTATNPTPQNYVAESFEFTDHNSLPLYEKVQSASAPHAVDDYFADFHESTREENPIPSLQKEARLNPRYTFDSFVPGESNRFAHATALAVAESPGSTYNPLFLYSDSGMGKTHLLHAIGNYTLTLFPKKKVLYVSSEEFTNAFINALRDQKVHTFKDQFRTVDVLLIDDIQFISKKEQTLDEFFHTFNALSTANKQIVITSDVAPKYLQGFEDRMISRFASGITASIDLPNLETRIAILDKKSGAENMAVPREVIEYIGTHMTSNVREMEGALRRVTAYADLAQQPVTLSMAELVLKDMISDPSSLHITASVIMAQTASYFKTTVENLTAASRSRAITMPRHIAMYLCREMTDLSLPKIAEVFNRRDHTTVINALRNVENKMAANQSIYNQVTELTAKIKRAAQDQLH